MPSFRWPPRRDESARTDESLAALLAGALPPEDVPPELRPALDVLAALHAQPGRDELLDEAAALAEFRIRAARPGPAGLPRRRRPVRLLPSLSAKIAAATAVIAVALGGVAAAAVVGVLPTPVQRLAHDLGFRAPGNHRSKHKIRMTSGSARGPHEAAAQCAAYARAQAGGSASRRARIRRELAIAAGGADRIDAYCARPGRHPIAPAPVGPRHHLRCAPVARASWSMHPRPSWTPTVRPTIWPTASGTPTRYPILDPTRCGFGWRWHSGWRLRHQRWTGGRRSPSPSAPPRTGEPGHHRIRVPLPHSGDSPAPQSSPQSRLGHTTARPIARSGKPAQHAAKLVKPAAHGSHPAPRTTQSGQPAQLSGAVRT